MFNMTHRFTGQLAALILIVQHTMTGNIAYYKFIMTPLRNV